ncbi:MAG: hypothetical protein H6707_19995 [Deltaproteobacteria bacterium]|nr:hypothetical protein [Deltaproteobacteria bacterium]
MNDRNRILKGLRAVAIGLTLLVIGCGSDAGKPTADGSVADKGLTSDGAVKSDATVTSDSAVSNDAATTSDGATAIRWAAAWTVLNTKGCTDNSCHGSGAGGLGFSQESDGPKLVDAAANKKCNTATKLVVPGDAASSVFYLRLAGTSCGTQMPKTRAIGPSDAPLTATELKLVADWINGGAK